MPVKLTAEKRGELDIRKDLKTVRKFTELRQARGACSHQPCLFRSCKYIPPKDAKGFAPLVAMGIESTNNSVLGRDYSDDSDDPPFCCLAQPPVSSRLLLRVNDHLAFCLGHSSIQNVSVFQIPIVELHTRSHDPL